MSRLSKKSFAALDDLDEALIAVRRVFQQPGYRRTLLAGLSHNLDLGSLRLLRAIQRADLAPSIGEIADTLAIDPSTASRSIGRAASSGFLERRPCDEDRRMTRLYLTDQGANILDEATNRRRNLLTYLTEEWPTGDIAQLTELLRKLHHEFDALENRL